MFRMTRALWMATKALSDVLYLLGDRDSTRSNRIVSIDEVDPDQLTFQQLVEVYRKRTLRDGVIMHLIYVAAFWLGRSRSASSQAAREEAESNFRVVAEAATNLAQREWSKETDHRGLILKNIEEEILRNF